MDQRLFKTGGRLLWHARYFVLQLAELLAESYLDREPLWADSPRYRATRVASNLIERE